MRLCSSSIAPKSPVNNTDLNVENRGTENAPVPCQSNEIINPLAGFIIIGFPGISLYVLPAWKAVLFLSAYRRLV